MASEADAFLGTNANGVGSAGRRHRFLTRFYSIARPARYFLYFFAAFLAFFAFFAFFTFLAGFLP
jgi:hypothetical protein